MRLFVAQHARLNGVRVAIFARIVERMSIIYWLFLYGETVGVISCETVGSVERVYR